MPTINVSTELHAMIRARAQAEDVDPAVIILRGVINPDAHFAEWFEQLARFIDEVADLLTPPGDGRPRGQSGDVPITQYIRDQIALYLGEHQGLAELLDRQRELHPEDFAAAGDEREERGPRPTAWDRIGRVGDE